MYKPLIYLISAFVLLSCDSKKEVADIIITNANIYTVNETNPKAQSFAIKEGRFLMVGSVKDIKDHYHSKNVLDLEGKTVLPGLIDGHCHLRNLGNFMQKVDLVGTNSFDEVLEKVVDFQTEKKRNLYYGKRLGSK